MRKLLKIQSDWFIGNHNRVHLVPDNKYIVRVAETKIPDTTIDDTLWYNYDYDHRAGIRLGVLFVRDKSNLKLAKDNIGFHPYLSKSFSHPECDFIDVQDHYTAFNDTNTGVLSTIKMGCIVWSIVGYEQLVSESVLLTLKQMLM
jgi:hypothetical protein